MFPHCERREDESMSSFYRRKAYILGHMMKLTIDVALGIVPQTDREHYKYKRLDASGDLMFSEFKRIYGEVSKHMLLAMDQRVHYEQKEYEGTKIVNLLTHDNINIK
jgi:DNA-directed RNA polymerase beta subunit